MEQYICLRYFLVWYDVCKEYVWDANVTQKVKSYEKGQGHIQIDCECLM